MDIDTQAVEVTKLSLLLKVLEGDNAVLLRQQQNLFHVLPDLGSNIKCGNSLIGPDFYEGQQLSMFDEEERYRINVFDWEEEFPKIMKVGGFDAVIGNPPYLNAVEEVTRFSKEIKEYVRKKFKAAKGAVDASILFQEMGLTLSRPAALTSFIVPNKFLSAPFGAAFRSLAAKEAQLTALADFSTANVFSGVGVYPVVYVLKKRNANARRAGRMQVSLERWMRTDELPQLAWSTKKDADLSELETWSQLFSSGENILARLRRDFPKLGQAYEVAASASADEAYRIKKCLVDGSGATPGYRFVTSGLIDRYTHTHGLAQVRYLKSDYAFPVLPKDCDQLSQNRQRQYSSAKIIVAGMTKRLEAILVDGKIAGSVPTVQIIGSEQSLKAVVAVVNSLLIDWVFKQYFSSLSLAGGYLRIGVPQISDLPIIDFENDPSCQKLAREKLIPLVDQMHAAHSKLRNAKTPHSKTAFQREITALDRQIDQLVYELYGLSDEEIALVEAATTLGAATDPDTAAESPPAAKRPRKKSKFWDSGE